MHWAVLCLSTAAAPAPELSGLEQDHLERAAFMVQDARTNVLSVIPQSADKVAASFDPSGRPRTLLVQVAEACYETTVTLSGPVTLADGATKQTFTGGERDKYLALVVPEGVTAGDFTPTLTATMPSTRLTVLTDDEYRDLLIAGQDHTVTWSAGAALEIDKPSAPDDDIPGQGTQPSDEADVEAPVEDAETQDAETQDADDVDTADGSDAGESGGEHDALVLESVTDADAGRKATALVEAFVLFETQTSTHTEVVTETTMTAGGAAYARPVMADTGMGATQAKSGRSGAAPVLLAVIAVVTGFGSWMMRRRKPSSAAEPAAAN